MSLTKVKEEAMILTKSERLGVDNIDASSKSSSPVAEAWLLRIDLILIQSFLGGYPVNELAEVKVYLDQ